VRGAVKAAVVGAAVGAVVSPFLYFTATVGFEAGFRARQAVADRRARREKQEREAL
jgi:hypothetical protein